MSSQLSALLGSVTNTVKRDFSASTDLSAGQDDIFSKMIDASAPSSSRSSPATAQPQASSSAVETPQDTTASQTESAAAPEDLEAAAAEDAEVIDETEVSEEAVPTESIAIPEELLAALAGLTEGQSTSLDDLAIDPERLAELKKALQEMADALGMDLSTMVQQLTQLAQPTADGTAVADLGFGTRLTQWLGEKLKTAEIADTPELESAFSKLLTAAKSLTTPSEPVLAAPDLTLDEPVLTGKASPAADEAPQSAEAGKTTPAPEKSATDRAATSAETPKSTAQSAPDDATRLAAQVQQTTQTEPSQIRADTTATGPRVVQSGYQTSQQQLNLPQLAFEVARQAQDGNTRFQIRLDPAELGRIDVKLDIDKSGQVTARLTVEKAETMDMMQRDRTALERALQQAGLDTTKTDLEFSLKQNPFAGDGGGLFGERGGSPGQNGATGGDEDTDAAPAPVTLYRGNVSASGVNIIA